MMIVDTETGEIFNVLRYEKKLLSVEMLLDNGKRITVLNNGNLIKLPSNKPI